MTVRLRRNISLAAFSLAFVCSLLNVSSFAQSFPGLSTRPPDEPAIAGKPVETRPASPAGEKPAFPGQTRAPAFVTKTSIQIDVVAHGLAHPWGLAFLPDGKILITEKPGKMRILTTSGTVGSALEGVPAVVFRGDAGLLDVVLDPAFTTNRRIYFTYVEPRESGNGVSVAKAVLSKDETKLEDLTVILRIRPDARPTAHYGSRLLFDKSGYLFVTTGDRYMEPTRAQAQSLDSQMGKLLRITTDGKPAPGNPFLQTPGALPEIWTYGHRNSQGLTFNPLTGDLLEIEHGTRGGDEVNLIKAGQNYGWPVIAYGEEYDGKPINGGLTAKEGMQQPLYYWDPSIATSGATFYSANLIPEWKNNLFVCALIGEHVSRLVLNGTHVVGEERLLLDQHQRMRDIQQGPDGALWVVTDDPDGRLIRIAPHAK